MVTSTNIRQAVATRLVDQLQKDSNSSLRAAFTQHHNLLIQAVEGVMVEPTTQQIARTDFLVAYSALVSNKSVTINLRPLIYRFTGAMHQVDPQLPATPTHLKHAIVTIKRRGAAVRVADSILPVELFLGVLSFVGVTLTTGFLVRRARKQYWALGLSLGIPTLLILIGGFGIDRVMGRIHFNDPNSKVIATEFANRLAKAAYITSLWLALLTVLTLAVWYVGRAWRQRRGSRLLPEEYRVTRLNNGLDVARTLRGETLFDVNGSGLGLLRSFLVGPSVGPNLVEASRVATPNGPRPYMRRRV